jgi:D-cysteine desulfhydrase family pyridoxal phosphate-dependent enzyme
MRFEAMPRVRLADLPTPLEELTKLRRLIGGPRLLIKRDDKTGLGYGGNKLRKLEYLFGDALRQGADTIITSGAAQTNHGRLTAAAAAKMGLKCMLVLTEERPAKCEANMILDKLFGAEMFYVTIDQAIPACDRNNAYLAAGELLTQDIVQRLQQEGHKPYVIPRGGRSLPGTCGYILAVLELYQQLIAQGITADYIVLPAATCSTMTGVLLGTKVFSLSTKVLGISVSRSTAVSKALVTQEFNHDATALEYSWRISPDEVQVTDAYLGDGYAQPTPATYAAINLLAREEGILLDPVYTGKAMAGLIDLIQQGYFGADKTVVFLHTGGSPALFKQAYVNN